MKNFVALLLLGLSQSAFAIGVGDTGPDFTFDHFQVDGSVRSGNLLQRTKAGDFLLVNFFRTNCGPCVTELPTLHKFADEMRDAMTLRYSTRRDTPDTLRAFLAKKPNSFNGPIALDPQGLAASAYDVQYVPTTYVFDANNVIRYVHVGLLEDEELNEIRAIVRGTR